MTTYTTKEYIAELDRRLATINKADLIKDCAFAAHEKQVTRMFEDQKNANGQALIGEYSTKWISIGAANTPRKPSRALEFVPFNKAGREKTGKKGYYAYVFKQGEGYKQFKKEIGRKFFELFGDLKKDFSTSMTRFGDHFVTGTKHERNSKKVNSLIDKYGEVAWKLSDEEKRQYVECVANKLTKIMSNA
jgi:hypothetical protein